MGIVTVFYALQLPVIQTLTLQRATEYLSEKLGSKVKIEKAKLTWFDEITLENVTIYDYKNREMIFVKELYVNSKTNFNFDWNTFLTFDNNLDYVMVLDPRVKLIYESDGDLNIDKWLARIEELTSTPDTAKVRIEHNIPFTIDEAYIQGGTFTLQDPEEKRFPKEEFDYNNFTVHGVQGLLKDFFIQGDTIKFALTDLKGTERRSNLEIKELNTQFFYSRQHMRFDDLYARINNSTLTKSVHFNYITPRDFSDFNEKVEMIGDLRNCEIDAQDLGRFATDMYQYHENYLLNGDFKGTVHDFRVKDFNLKFGQNSYLDGEIAFKNMPDLRKAVMDLTWKPSQIDAIDARQYVGDSLYQQHVQKFGITTFAGIFKGLYNDFTTDAFVKSQLGLVAGNITMKIPNGKALPTYTGSLMVDDLELGKLVNEETMLQKMSFTGDIKGKGLTIKDALLNFDGTVKHIWFNGYDFQNITVDGEMSQSLFDGRVSVKDTNLTFDITGKVDFSKALNKFDIHGIVQNANLRALGYAQNDVKLKSELTLDFQGNELDNWIGRAQLLHTVLQYDKRKLGIDSVFVTSALDSNSRHISLLSEFFNIDITGKFTPSQVISDVTRFSKEYTQYFVENEASRMAYYVNLPAKGFQPRYNLDYKVLFKKSDPFFAYFYPALFISPNTELNGQLNIRNTVELSLGGKIDTLRHGSFAFYNNELDFNTSKEVTSPKILTSLVFNSEKQKLGDMAPTEKLEVNGAWGQANVIEFDAKIKQQKSSNRAQVFGHLAFLQDEINVSFNDRNTKLDLLGETWLLAKNNLINFYESDICFQDVAISNKNQSISMSGYLSQDSLKEAYVNVQDFNLQTLEPLTNVDLKGIVNGKLMLRDVYNDGLITSEFNVDNLKYENSLIGTVSGGILWDNVTQKLNVNGNIVRINNEIFSLSGTYDPKDEYDPLNLKANLEKADLEIFQSFIDDIFSNIRGYGSGTLTVRGTPGDPVIRGSVAVEKGSLLVNELNTPLYFDDRINFNEEGFVVEKGFRVRDTDGNEAELAGGIFNGGSGNFMLGIHAYMRGRDGFRIMNTTIKNNEDFYGTGVATGDLHITGSLKNVAITGNLTSKKDTKITIPLDGATYVNTEEEGITFVSRNEKHAKNKGEKKDSTLNEEAGSLKMAFNFTITPDAECVVIFDRINKDELTAVGNGRISIEYDTRGGFTMTGPYTIRSGKYDFSLQNISRVRKFDIADGSWIRWSGDPYDATISINAIVTANVFLPDGIASGTNSAELRTTYPVSAYVILTDKLMKPTIKYDIKFDQRRIPLNLQPQVIAFEQRLRNDEQLLANNFVGVAAFNRLFSDNSFRDVVDSQLLLDNVSSLLTNQLGTIASKINPNLEIGVQLGALSTLRQNMFNNVQVNFSYRFSNNRLKLSVNNTILQNQEQTAGNYFYGGEVEWLLNEDGSWRLKAYSRNVPNYFYNFNTNVTVNGVSLQHTRSFNTIFKRKTPPATPKSELSRVSSIF
ncbi:translocation/assembly module TamB domain-containing protein [Emticicia sp. BO119]|uniref:translocation/assembly module TamB domain-containing protein n=1 Tax=Emticicia sp. BO119 TaxID=2757768 RepID=UPI0015F0CD91|nr:translocation/assembly module TamB domain-containing protein [Emticicia sp. BO119]MBA4851153.1 translocation/assembly module TamB domain-containing protein [Emticicia sp. BO119]